MPTSNKNVTFLTKHKPDLFKLIFMGIKLFREKLSQNKVACSRRSVSVEQREKR